jgi:hypothetical protein
MAVYWCRFFDGDGRVYAAEKLVCSHLDDAIEKARRIMADGEGSSFELWERSTRVHAEHSPSEQTN